MTNLIRFLDITFGRFQKRVAIISKLLMMLFLTHLCHVFYATIGTEPSSEEVIINGRVGSLLEVGTGFHQELTGRENIYMNGTYAFVSQIMSR